MSLAERSAWEARRDDGARPEDVCREAAAEGVDTFTRIRFLRAVFGLSLDEAKAAELGAALHDQGASPGAPASDPDEIPDAELLLTFPGTEIPTLEHYPPYVVHALRLLAPQAVAKPEVVFEGIRRDGALRRGFAFCSRLPSSVDPQGRKVTAPEGMTFVVYSDEYGMVFDWDWVRADGSSAAPVDAADRFGKRLDSPPSAAVIGVDELTVGTFNPACASYSRIGDCIFAYVSPSPGFAERVNDDLTLFKSFEAPNDIVGLKLKNVEASLQAAFPKGAGDVPLVSVDDVDQVNVAGATSGSHMFQIELRVMLSLSKTRQHIRSAASGGPRAPGSDAYARIDHRFEAAEVEPVVELPHPALVAANKRMRAGA